MKFDSLGLPQENGATDLQDSARLAGIMTAFNWPRKIELREYFIFEGRRHIYVRHPLERKYDFSRDQFICLAAGFRAQDRQFYVNSSFVTGKDFLSPSVKGHEARCQGASANWFQDLWLYADILYHAKVTPLGEPNQLLCMMRRADRKFIRFWVNQNKQWAESILNYWCQGPGAWRGETELAHHIISEVWADYRA